MSSISNIKTIVIGALNTDLIVLGLDNFPKPGKHVYGKEFRIGPGGKSRNIADMIGHLSPRGTVAMVGRTIKDPYNLWSLPVIALKQTGVNTKFVKILPHTGGTKLPSIVVIAVDKCGNNQLYAVPGISDDFSPKDVDIAQELFASAARNNGLLVITLECPVKTVEHAALKARRMGMRVILDPGGITTKVDVARLLKSGLYLIKPNEHEAKILTGVKVVDARTAKLAARKLRDLGIKNVLITVGEKGAYLFNGEIQKHIAIPRVRQKGTKDATGCGDQTMAALCAFLQERKSLEEAAELAVLAGTLQFHKIGIQPLDREELLQATID